MELFQPSVNGNGLKNGKKTKLEIKYDDEDVDERQDIFLII